MLSLKIAGQFIRKKRIQSLIVIFTIIIGVGVQFFVATLGGILSTMILEQTSHYQDHLVITKNEAVPSNEQLFTEAFREELTNEFPEIKYTLYSTKLNGTITTEAAQSLPFSLFMSEITSDQSNYLTFYGIGEPVNIISGRGTDLEPNELLLDDWFAQQNNIKVEDSITFKSEIMMESFIVAGTFDLGVYKRSRNYAYINYPDLLVNFKDRISLSIQLHDVQLIAPFKVALKSYIGEAYSVITWADQYPELAILDDTQKAVVYVIQLLLSIAVFAIILSIFSFMIEQKNKQIGILKAMGLENKTVFAIFLWQSVILSGIGTLIGLIGGTFVMLFYHNYMRYPNGTHRFLLMFKFGDYLTAALLSICVVLIATAIAINKVRKTKVINLIK